MLVDRRTTAAGFTLLETIVALVVLSVVMMAFFEFLSGVLNSATRINTASIGYDRQMNALEIATAINPMDLPEGSLNLGPYRVDWETKPLGDIRQSSGYPGGLGIFKVALYRIVFRFPDAAEIAPIEVRKLGYRRDNVPETPITSTPEAGLPGGAR